MELTKTEADGHLNQVRYYRLVDRGPQMLGTVVEIDAEAEDPFVCLTWDPNQPAHVQCFTLDSLMYLRDPAARPGAKKPQAIAELPATKAPPIPVEEEPVKAEEPAEEEPVEPEEVPVVPTSSRPAPPPRVGTRRAPRSPRGGAK